MNREEGFSKKGFIGPFSIPEDLATSVGKLSWSNRHFLMWEKGWHLLSKELAILASHPKITNEVEALLGANIVLSGSQLIVQRPGKKHRWHVDLEHKEWEGLTVWVALKNVKKRECISIIKGSHHFSITPEDLKIKGKDTFDDEQILAAAHEIDPEAELLDLDIKDGEFFIFHGKLWHATRNLTADTRTALIFQYCRPDQKVKVIGDINYPNICWRNLQPECMLVNGKDEYNVNKTVTLGHAGSLIQILRGYLFNLPRNFLFKSFRRLNKYYPR